MPGNERKSGFGDWAGIITTISLLCGALWVSDAPDVPRQTLPLMGDSAQLIEDADARLWQDPFDAVMRHRETEHKKEDCYRLVAGKIIKEKDIAYQVKHDSSCVESKKKEFQLDDLHDLIGTRLKEGNVTVLGIMINGGSYVGNDELRRQARYAVLAGLNEEGYIPDDAQHLGHILHEKNKQDEHFPSVVPFEWMLKENLNEKNSKKDRILVLWLNEEAFDGEYYDPNDIDKISKHRPLQNLNKFLKRLANSDPHTNSLDFQIIGPGDSTVLEHMADEEIVKDVIPNLNFYSPWASIHNERLNELLKKNDVQLHRIGPDDFILAEVLKNELNLRDVSDTRHIALINQWDTTYARHLGQTICEVLTGITDDKCLKESQIIHYEFLRGLDGKTLDQKPKKQNDTPKDSKESVTGGSSVQPLDERAEGDAQIDYLRRIRNDLLKKDYDLREEDGTGIRAIGLVANDYYDKLLILSIFRSAFPDAIFFTTDIDANMLNSSDDRYMRNLIVASSFGFSLNKGLQQDIPPFRTSSQTGVYAAVLVALQSRSSVGNIGANWEPRLFEIGRNDAVELESAQPETESDDLLEPLEKTCIPSDLSRCDDPHPDYKPRHDPPNLFWIFSIVSLVVLGLVIPSAFKFKYEFFNEEKISKWLGIFGEKKYSSPIEISLTIVYKYLIGLIIAIILWGYNYSMEPFFWAQGVSVWPSEIIRIVAIGLSFYFIHKINEIMRTRDIEIGELFFYEIKEDIKKKENSEILKIIISNEFDVISFLGILIKEKTFIDWEKHLLIRDKYSAIDAWKEYLKEPIILPAILYTLLFFSACFCFMYSFGLPQSPIRDHSLFIIDLIITMTAVILFIFLIFYVKNATSRITRLAKKLWGRTVWDKKDLDNFGLYFGKVHQHGGQIGFEDWLDIKLIARCTEAIKPLIFYPISILSLLLLSRNRLFDAWIVPWPLLLIYCVSLLIIIYTAMQLRRAAEDTREHSIEHLKTALLRANKCKGEVLSGVKGDSVIAQLEKIIDEANNINQGAFSSFTQQAHVQAILALIASVSSIKLLDYFQFG
jgi:hypothetical protein